MITSTSNGKIKNLIQLQKKAKVRREQDVFLTEGMKMYQEAPKERIVQTFASESFYNRHPWMQKDPAVEVVDDRVFNAASDTRTPQGILCVVKQYHYPLKEVLQGETPLLLLLENIQDPGNLGTIMRTAEGAGVTGMIMSRETVDLYNPKTIRSTMGSIYRMPFHYAEDLQEILTELKKRHISTYAAHLGGAAFYDEQDYRSGTAFLIGNEGNGLTEELAVQADKYIKIPMCGEVESLNAGIASSILMYEALRQRRSQEFSYGKHD